MFQVLTSGNYNTEQVRKTVIGLARDLRGIAFAFNTKVSMRYYNIINRDGNPLNFWADSDSYEESAK